MNAVTVMDVNIDVQNTRMKPEELQDGQDDVVDVAESGSLSFVGMVEAARPIDGDICAASAEVACPEKRGSRILRAKGEDIRKCRAIIGEVEARELLQGEVWIV